MLNQLIVKNLSHASSRMKEYSRHTSTRNLWVGKELCLKFRQFLLQILISVLQQQTVCGNEPYSAFNLQSTDTVMYTPLCLEYYYSYFHY